MLDYKLLERPMTKQEMENYLKSHPALRLPTREEYNEFMSSKKSYKLSFFDPIFLSDPVEQDIHYWEMSAKTGIEPMTAESTARVLLVYTNRPKHLGDTVIAALLALALALVAFVAVDAYKITDINYTEAVFANEVLNESN